MHLQIEEIMENCETPAQVKSALKSLPPTLQETYEQCLKRKRNSRLICKPNVLKWCVAAKSPLSLTHLSEMLAIDGITGEIHRSDIPEAESIIRSAVSLLMLDETEMVLVPIHSSVRQFLFSGYIQLVADVEVDFLKELGSSIEDAEVDLACISLKHMKARTGLHLQTQQVMTMPAVKNFIPPRARIFWPFKDGSRIHTTKLPSRPTPTTDDDGSFLRYAIRTWTLHTRNLTSNHAIWPMFKNVALEPNASWELHPWSAPGGTNNSHLRGLFGFAVAHNHLPLLQLIVDNPGAMKPPDIYDRPLPEHDLLPALHVAARFGYDNLIPLLLKVCDINSRFTELGQTALHIAASQGQDNVVRLLSNEPGVDINTVDRAGDTPFRLAMASAHVNSVMFLFSTHGLQISDMDAQSMLFSFGTLHAREIITRMFAEGTDEDLSLRFGAHYLCLHVCKHEIQEYISHISRAQRVVKLADAYDMLEVRLGYNLRLESKESKRNDYIWSICRSAQKNFTSTEVAVVKRVLGPLSACIKLYENFQSIFSEHKVRRLDYSRRLADGYGNKNSTKRTIEGAEAYIALDNRLSNALPQLFMLTAVLVQNCLHCFVDTQRQFFSLWETELRTTLELAGIAKTEEADRNPAQIESEIGERLSMLERRCMALSICNGTILAGDGSSTSHVPTTSSMS